MKETIDSQARRQRNCRAIVRSRLPINPSGIVPTPFRIVAGTKAITRLTKNLH